MLVVVTRMIASVGASTKGSGTSSTRTSRMPCQVTAFMSPPSISTGSVWWRVPVTEASKRSAQGGHQRAAGGAEGLDHESQVREDVGDRGVHRLLKGGVGRGAPQVMQAHPVVRTPA